MTREDLVKAAARAHTNLTMYHAIVALCESGCFYGHEPHKPIDRIIAICKKESAKELDRHDRAIEMLGGRP